MPKRRSFESALAAHSGAREGSPLGPGNFEQASGPGEGPNKSPFVRSIPPPYLNKLPSSRDFNRNVFSSVLAAGVGNTVTPVTFQLPEGFVGFVQIVGFYVLTPTALFTANYALRINEGPVEGYDNQQLPPGVANFLVQNFSDIQIRIPNGGKVDVLVTNLSAAGPWTVGAKIAGYYHPLTEERRIFGDL